MPLTELRINVFMGFVDSQKNIGQHQPHALHRLCYICLSVASSLFDVSSGGCGPIGWCSGVFNRHSLSPCNPSSTQQELRSL